MSLLRSLVQLLSLAVLTVAVTGIVQRTKSIWGGRRGPPVLQFVYDIARLMRKRAVYSTTTTLVFRVAPYVSFATAVVSGLLAPVLGVEPPLGFRFDFMVFAYIWGTGRLALVLGALDTGSSFEGMGASREATFSAIVEPAFVIVTGAACLLTHERSFSALLELRPISPLHSAVWLSSVVALFIVVQVESARIPIDDPATHLELTMIHEVMILDHSGPDLAVIQVGSALKMTVGLALLACLLNPAVGHAPLPIVSIVHAAITLVLATVTGTIESLIARFKLRAVPQYILVAIVASGVALLATTFRVGGG